MTTIPLADAKARLSAVLDEVRDTHERVVITRNGHPEAVILSVSNLETLEETLDLLSTPGALDRGAYRVIYRIDGTERMVHVVRIDHRADVYRTR